MNLTERTTWLGAVMALILVPLAHGATERTVYTFGAPGSGDGMYPYCSLVADGQGNLYGTTSQGGTYSAGIVFEVSPGQNGQWTETVLHEFTGTDGANPSGGVVFDSVGNLYGTAGYGGANGTGVVFELSPQGPDWTYTVLYNFGAYPSSGDGFGASAKLGFDKLGNLYGTTYEGGKAGCFQGCGTVFELSPVQGGGWKEQVLHAFAEDGTDGVLPSGVAVTSNGVVYGTTQNGGTAGSGVLYQLEYSPAQNLWIETIVHQFVGGSTDGAFPESELLIHAGRLYGTSEGGGTNSDGTVFETAFFQNTGWRTKVLYSFGPPYSGDGLGPQTGLTMDKQGNLYGTTSYGGAYNYYGTVFKLSLQNHTWIETTLHSFSGNDGFYPGGSVIIKGGRLYGTTSNGGNSSGLVFQIGP